MKRFIGLGIVVLIIATMAFGPVSAQDNSEATISALQTQIADVQATSDARGDKINAQRTQIADLKSKVPTPTATSAPRATVAANPKVLADGLELLYYYTIEDGSSTTLLGEVRNTTDQRLDSPYFRIVLLDSDGNIVDTTTASAALVTIGPGEAMPFETSIYGIDRDEWQLEEISACDWPSDFYVREGYGESPVLELVEVVEVEKSSDRLSIEGKVLNAGESDIEGVEVHAFVYLPDGRYAGDVISSIDVAIPSGKTARFTLDGGSYDIPGLALPALPLMGSAYTYRLWVGTNPNATVHFC